MADTTTGSTLWDNTDTNVDGNGTSDLYRDVAWVINQFPRNRNFEIQSKPFAAGGYDWVITLLGNKRNQISVFLGVADIEKLPSGLSVLVQFSLYIRHTDPSKSLCADMLHRFTKERHEFGWQYLMKSNEDAFQDGSHATVNAEVQVIRDKSGRPFRCLDRLYGRQMLLIYMKDVEKEYNQFIKKKLNDVIRLGGMSCSSPLIVETNVVLKKMVAYFFSEKKIISSLLMDAIHSGLRALESQRVPNPLFEIDENNIIVTDFSLLRIVFHKDCEKVFIHKDDGSDTTKSGSLFALATENLHHWERCLKEMGLKMVEVFTLAYIYELEILKKQQELILLFGNENQDNKCKKPNKKKGKKINKWKKNKGEQEREETTGPNESLIIASQPADEDQTEIEVIQVARKNIKLLSECLSSPQKVVEDSLSCIVQQCKESQRALQKIFMSAVGIKEDLHKTLSQYEERKMAMSTMEKRKGTSDGFEEASRKLNGAASEGPTLNVKFGTVSMHY